MPQVQSAQIVPWNGDAKTASAVLTSGFSDYAIPQVETNEAIIGQVNDGYIAADSSFIARSEGAAVGGVFAAFRPDGKARIHSMAIDPPARGHGLGRELLQRAIAGLWTRGCSEIHLEVLINNTAAISLYQSEGFVIQRLFHCVRGPLGGKTRRNLRELAPRDLGDHRRSPISRPLHRDALALEHIPGVRVVLDEITSCWAAFRGSTLFDADGPSLESSAILLFDSLPAQNMRIIDLPDDDSLQCVLRDYGWTQYAQQWEMILLPRPSASRLG